MNYAFRKWRRHNSLLLYAVNNRGFLHVFLQWNLLPAWVVQSQMPIASINQRLVGGWGWGSILLYESLYYFWTWMEYQHTTSKTILGCVFERFRFFPWNCGKWSNLMHIVRMDGKRPPINPSLPNTSWEGVVGMFLGSKHLFTRCLEAWGKNKLKHDTLPETNSKNPWKSPWFPRFHTIKNGGSIFQPAMLGAHRLRAIPSVTGALGRDWLTFNPNLTRIECGECNETDSKHSWKKN